MTAPIALRRHHRVRCPVDHPVPACRAGLQKAGAASGRAGEIPAAVRLTHIPMAHDQEPIGTGPPLVEFRAHGIQRRSKPRGLGLRPCGPLGEMLVAAHYTKGDPG